MARLSHWEMSGRTNLGAGYLSIMIPGDGSARVRIDDDGNEYELPDSMGLFLAALATSPSGTPGSPVPFKSRGQLSHILGKLDPKSQPVPTSGIAKRVYRLRLRMAALGLDPTLVQSGPKGGYRINLRHGGLRLQRTGPGGVPPMSRDAVER